MSDAAHPRDSFALDGMEKADHAVVDALARSRMHHAWLLNGPEGVGKASFAYRIARRLLGAAPDPSLGSLASRSDDPVSRQVSARSHPDLMVLERATDDGKARKSIPVDEARALPAFFANSPAAAPYRVAIIDAADDLNVNAANAVLKTLEEPPERGVLLLISHSPGRLLPTLRSRCRTLSIPAMEQGTLAAELEQRLGLGEREAQRLAAMSRGALGRALRLAQSGALAADDAARGLLTGLPKLDEAALLALADSFRGGDGAARFALVFERLAEQVHEMAVADSLAGRAAGLDRWASVWSDINRLASDTEALNLDRADALWSAVAQLRSAAA
jgi:DNA polymerase-3 subunit delta'